MNPFDGHVKDHNLRSLAIHKAEQERRAGEAAKQRARDEAMVIATAHYHGLGTPNKTRIDAIIAAAEEERRHEGQRETTTHHR